MASQLSTSFRHGPALALHECARSDGDLVLSGWRRLAVWAAVLLIIGFNIVLLLQVAGVIRD